MYPDKLCGRFFHGIFVERKRIVQHIAPEHGRHHFPAIQAIAVDFSSGRPSGTEIGASLLGRDDTNGRRKQRVQGALKLRRRERRLRAEAGHLAKSVHTGIRPASARQLDTLLGQAAEHGNYFTLDRWFIRLNLPAVEVGAVVGNREFEMTHSGSW